MATLKLAIAQFAPVQGDLAANSAFAASKIRELSGQCDIVVFPEVFLSGYDVGREKVRAIPTRCRFRPRHPTPCCVAQLHELGIRNDSPYLQEIADAARDAGVAVVMSYPEHDGADYPASSTTYIATVVFESDGM